MELLDLVTNLEAILGFVIAAAGTVLAVSKKIRRKLRAGAKAARDTE